jgi:hypothetical protein
MRTTERIAKRLLEAAMPGASMTFRDSQANGEYDFDLRLPTGALAAVEVTAASKQQHIAFLAALTDPKKGGDSFTLQGSTVAWWLWLSSKASIDRVRNEAGTHLLQLETSGITAFSGDDTDLHPSIEVLHDALGVQRAHAWKADPGTVRMAPAGTFSWASAEAMNMAINTELLKQDNRAKLQRAMVAERHLFVYVEGSLPAAWIAFTEDSPPTSSPALPPEITHLWAAAHSGRHHGFRLFQAQDVTGWRDVGVFPGTPDAL